MQKTNHKSVPAAVRRHPLLMRVLTYAPIVLISCCFFPLRFPARYLDVMILFLLLVAACNLGNLLACLYGRGKLAAVYLRLLAFTVLGLACRYLLEYGEVSNTYNFTQGNTAVFLLLFPFWTVVAYLFFRTGGSPKRTVYNKHISGAEQRAIPKNALLPCFSCIFRMKGKEGIFLFLYPTGKMCYTRKNIIFRQCIFWQ